ncbi:MAG: peptidoglycan-binding domain-containing protein [Paracoccaceae bacterium]
MNNRTGKINSAIFAAALSLGLVACGSSPEGAASPGAQQQQSVSTSSSSTPLGRRQVEEVQTLLARLGYSGVESDGVAGPRSRAAAMAFQRDAGVATTGDYDQTLLSMVRRTAEARGVATVAAPAPVATRLQ